MPPDAWQPGVLGPLTLLRQLIRQLRLTARESRPYNRGVDEPRRKDDYIERLRDRYRQTYNGDMGEPGGREVWSDDDDVLLKAWMAIYESPLTPPLSFEVVNAAGDAVRVSPVDVGSASDRRPWWEGWACLFPVTIHVRDVHGKGFSVSVPKSNKVRST